MMKRLIISIAIMIMCIVSFSSCTVHTYATTQDDIYVEAQADIVQTNVDYSVIVRYGTPYYYNGALLYYIYNNLYYYPYVYNRQWYVRAYRKPFNHLQHRPYFRPNKYDMRFKPGIYKGYDVPRKNVQPRPQNRRLTSQQIPNRSVRRDVQNAIRRPNRQVSPQRNRK